MLFRRRNINITGEEGLERKRKMAVEDDKVKRTRDLLSSFYSQDASQTSAPTNTTSRFATLDTINTTSFDADQYMNLLVHPLISS